MAAGARPDSTPGPLGELYSVLQTLAIIREGREGRGRKGLGIVGRERKWREGKDVKGNGKIRRGRECEEREGAEGERG